MKRFFVSTNHHTRSRNFSSVGGKKEDYNLTTLLFGANTDVGKSLVSAGLVRASNKNVRYIKPLQCGGSDAKFVERHMSGAANNVTTKTLFTWKTPTSPHLACQIENKFVSPQQLRQTLHDTLNSPQNKYEMTIVETAGGVLSPTSCGTDDPWIPQANLYQSLLSPSQKEAVKSILVGDAKLGGISCTISSLEALLLRTYTVSAIVFVGSDDYCDNASTLNEYIPRLQIPNKPIILSLPPIPSDENIPLHSWYDQTQPQFQTLYQHLLQTKNDNNQ